MNNKTNMLASLFPSVKIVRITLETAGNKVSVIIDFDVRNKVFGNSLSSLVANEKMDSMVEKYFQFNTIFITSPASWLMMLAGSNVAGDPATTIQSQGFNPKASAVEGEGEDAVTVTSYSSTFMVDSTKTENMFCFVSAVFDWQKLMMDFAINKEFIDPYKKALETPVPHKAGEVPDEKADFSKAYEPIVQDGVVVSEKTVDFRTVQTIKELQIDWSLSDNFQKFIDVPSEQKNSFAEYKPKSSYFSEAYISIKPDSSRNVFFSFDYRKYLRDHSACGKLYESKLTSLIENAFANSAIHVFEVYRGRRRRWDADTSFPFMDDNDGMEFVVSSGDISGKLTDVTNGAGNTIHELQAPIGLGIRSFVVHDKSITNKTYGDYAYFVKMVIEDGSPKILKNQLDTLISSRMNILEYLRLTEIPKFTDNDNTRKIFLNYDADTNRFRQAFIDEISGKLNLWLDPVKSYLNVLNIFESISGMALTDKNEVTTTILQLVNPKFATPKSINLFLELENQLINALESFVIAQGISSDVAVAGGLTGKSGPSGLKHRLEVEYLFDVLTDVDSVAELAGYEYLSDITPLGILDFGQFVLNAKDETGKYFTNEAPNVHISADNGEIVNVNDNVKNSEYAYFSPRAIVRKDSSTGEIARNLLTTTTPEDAADLVLYATASKIRKNSPTGPLGGIGGMTSGLALDDLALLAGLTLLENLDSNGGNEVTLGGLTGNNLDPSVILDPVPTSTVERKKETSQETLQQTSEERKTTYTLVQAMVEDRMPIKQQSKGTVNRKEPDKEPDVVFDPRSPSGAINKVRSQNGTEGVKSAETFVRELPNQLKSLLLTNSGSKEVRSPMTRAVAAGGIVKITPTLAPSFKLHYDMLYEIQVLTSFVKSNDGYHVKAPIWQKMTAAAVQGLLDGEHICRMVEYQSGLLGLSGAGNASLPVYDQFFVINKNAMAKKVTSGQQKIEDTKINNFLDKAKVKKFGKVA